jgi:Family of unknown function (DUF6502)
VSAEKTGDLSRSDVLLEQALALLEPLVRLLIANGVTYPQLVAALKPVFLRAAHTELSDSDKRLSDSAISIMSGVHRKDVRALTSEPSQPAPSRVPSLVEEVLARWMGDARYLAEDGMPRALPLRNGNEKDEPSFAQLTQSVSRDFHSRAVLEEMLRLSTVEVADDVVRLRPERALASHEFSESVSSVARNIRDHLAATERNLAALQAGDRSPFLEQSVSASDLDAESVRALQDLARRVWESAVRRVNTLAADSAGRDRQTGDQALRVRLGIYFYAQPESPLIRNGDLPVGSSDE